MKHFKHIVITRFNLPNRWNKDKFGNVVLNKTWLEDRYKLFEKYCLPSIKNQTNQNFEWWVYFDENISSFYKNKNEEIFLNYKKFVPKYEVSYDDFEMNMPKELYEMAKYENIDFLITTRLDNDDMLAKDTISLIQDKTKFNALSLLEIPFGYTLELSKKKSRLRKVKSYKNPFISLVEKVDLENQVKGVFHYQHNQWKDIYSQIISNKEQWIQIIHNKNVSNSSAGVEVLNNKIFEQFGFNCTDLKFDSLIIFEIRRCLLRLKRILYKLKKINY